MVNKEPDPSEEYAKYYSAFVPLDSTEYEPGQRILRYFIKLNKFQAD